MQSRPQDNLSGKISATDDAADDFTVEISDLRDDGSHQRLQKGLLRITALASNARKHPRGLLFVAFVLLIVVVIFPALTRFLAPHASIQPSLADPTLSSSFQSFSIGAVTHGVTYAIAPDQSLHALNTLDGAQLWQEKFPFYTANPQNTYVYVDNGFAYQVLQQNQIQVVQESKVQVLRLSDGQPLWRSDEAPPGNWPLLLDHGAIVSSHFLWVGNSISA